MKKSFLIGIDELSKYSVLSLANVFVEIKVRSEFTMSVMNTSIHRASLHFTYSAIQPTAAKCQQFTHKVIRSVLAGEAYMYRSQ